MADLWSSLEVVAALQAKTVFAILRPTRKSKSEPIDMNTSTIWIIPLVSGFRFRCSGFGFRVSGFGFRVSGFRSSGFGFRDSGLIVYRLVFGVYRNTHSWYVSYSNAK